MVLAAQHGHPTRRLGGEPLHEQGDGCNERRKTRDFSPHDLRRTCTGALLDRGVDLAAEAIVVPYVTPSA